MRINKFVANATGLSRRHVDNLIRNQQIKINKIVANLGDEVKKNDLVELNNKVVKPPLNYTTIMLNKPTGYVCSRIGQGSKTIYQLLPKKYAALKAIGRLDKDSSGLLLLTNNGQLAHELSHPKFNKSKLYLVELDRPLTTRDSKKIKNGGVLLDNRPSTIKLKQTDDPRRWKVSLNEGRNRQIRRTFATLNYLVVDLHRLRFGSYDLGNLELGKYIEVADVS